jgi:hypothetical protein
MYYFDANIFILPQIYEESISEVKKAKEYLIKLANGVMEGCTSALTWDEVVYIIRKYAGREESRATGRKFLSFPNLKIVPVNLEILSKAQKMVESFNIAPRDAIHASCALKFCNGRIVSNDSDFDRVEAISRIF